MNPRWYGFDGGGAFSAKSSREASGRRPFAHSFDGLFRAEMTPLLPIVTTILFVSPVFVAFAAGAQVRVVAGGTGVTERQLGAVSALAKKGIERLSPFFPGTPSHPIRVVGFAE